MDVEDIAPGQNFAEAIDRSIASAQIALIVIGPRWTQLLGERLHDQPTDYVAHEISSALTQKLRIVPVLVGGASMPGRDDLPPDLSALALCNAVELRDSTFRQDCERLAAELNLGAAKSLPRRWQKPALAAFALLALLLSVWALWNPRPPEPRLATARTQTELGEHRSAFETYREILKDGEPDPAVLDLQADAAMRWLPNFSVTVGEGQKAEDIAGPPLAEIIQVLEAALARTNSRDRRAADILAHLGWAHWLNWRIAQREFGPAAERALRQALTVDPGNTFAHAMLGNWLLQNNGDPTEALRHFADAEKSNQHRSLVRQMQLGGILSHQGPEMPAALMRVLNRMRQNGETLPDRVRSRSLTFFRPGNQDEIAAMLSAVPPSDAWATFLWLDQPAPAAPNSYEGFRRDFIHARVLELQSDTAAALAVIAGLEQRMSSSNYTGRFLDEVSQLHTRLRTQAR